MSSLRTLLLLVFQLLAGVAPRGAVVATAPRTREATWTARAAEERAAPLDRSSLTTTTVARASSTPARGGWSAAVAPPTSVRPADVRAAWPVRVPTRSHAVAARGGHLPYFPTAPPHVG